MKDYATQIIKETSALVLVVDRSGDVKWVNHGFYGLTENLLLTGGLERVELLMGKADRLVLAEQLDAVWRGTGETRRWKASLKVAGVGKVGVIIQAKKISNDQLSLEVTDFSEELQERLEMKRTAKELELITKITQLRKQYPVEESFYSHVLKLICHTVNADGAFLYAKQPVTQFMTGIALRKKIINDNVKYPLKDKRIERVELWREPNEKQSIPTTIYRHGFKTLLKVPLFSQEKQVGTILIFAHRVKTFSWSKIRLLVKVSDFIAHQVALDVSYWQQEHTTELSRAIFTNVRDGLLVVDPGGLITEANKAAATILGTEENSEALLQNLVIPGYTDSINRFIERVLANSSATVRVKFAANETPIFQLEGTLVSTGHQVLIICSVKDVTEWVNRQELLHQKTVRLEQLDQMKDQFISMVSHELRSPLTVLQGHLSLWDRDLNMVDRESVGAMSSSLRRLNLLVDDILLAAQMEYGELPLNYQSIQLKDFFSNLVNDFNSLFSSKKIKLQFKLSDLSLTSDEGRLYQIMSNLLTNSVKYCREGDVVLVSAVRRNGQVVIKIQDSGPGIAKEHLTHIFDRFYKVKADSIGAGLGLYITKRLVERLGGRITVSSRLGQGTTFTINLPAA